METQQEIWDIVLLYSPRYLYLCLQSQIKDMGFEMVGQVNWLNFPVRKNSNVEKQMFR